MKRFLLLCMAVVICSIFFSGCKKEKTGTGVIVGKYVVASGGYPALRYVQITEDSIYLMRVTNDFGSRSIQESATTITDDSLYYFSQGYSYTVSGEEVTIAGFLSAEPLVLVRSANVPEWDDFAKPVSWTSLGLQNLNNERFQDMTPFAGGVVSDVLHEGNNYLFKFINPINNSFTTFDIPIDMASQPLLGGTDNVEGMNNKLLVYYASNPGYLRVVTQNGTVESSIQLASSPGTIYALANDGTNLWGMTGTGIRKFDFVNNQFGTEFGLGGAGSFAGGNGYLYVLPQQGDFIQKFNATTNRVEGAYYAPDGFYYYGLAYFNGDLIASVYNQSASVYQLIKIVF